MSAVISDVQFDLVDTDTLVEAVLGAQDPRTRAAIVAVVVETLGATPIDDWGADVDFTVAEIVDEVAVAFPDQAWNEPRNDHDDSALGLGAEHRGGPGRPAVDPRHRQSEAQEDHTGRTQADRTTCDGRADVPDSTFRHTKQTGNTMSTKSNIAAQQAFGDTVNSGALQFDDLVAADSVDHDPAPGQVPGPAGYQALFTEMRTAFPDLHIEVEHLVADGDDVAFAYTVTGTHDGPFQGHPATGRAIKVRGMQISTFAHGLLVERWGSTDQLSILTQIGAFEA